MVTWMLTSLPESVIPANHVATVLKFIDIFYMMVQDRVTSHGKSNKTSLCALGHYFTKYKLFQNPKYRVTQQSSTIPPQLQRVRLERYLTSCWLNFSAIMYFPLCWNTKELKGQEKLNGRLDGRTTENV